MRTAFLNVHLKWNTHHRCKSSRVASNVAWCTVLKTPFSMGDCLDRLDVKGSSNAPPDIRIHLILVFIIILLAVLRLLPSHQHQLIYQTKSCCVCI